MMRCKRWAYSLLILVFLVSPVAAKIEVPRAVAGFGLSAHHRPDSDVKTVPMAFALVGFDYGWLEPQGKLGSVLAIWEVKGTLLLKFFRPCGSRVRHLGLVASLATYPVIINDPLFVSYEGGAEVGLAIFDRTFFFRVVVGRWHGARSGSNELAYTSSLGLRIPLMR